MVNHLEPAAIGKSMRLVSMVILCMNAIFATVLTEAHLVAETMKEVTLDKSCSTTATFVTFKV